MRKLIYIISLLALLFIFSSDAFCPPIGGGPIGGSVLLVETDPVVGAVTGIVEADGAGNIGAATAGVDYLTPTGSGATLTDIPLDSDFGSNGLMERTGIGTYGIATEGTDYYGAGGTDVSIFDGGTGASTAAGARSNLEIDTPSKSFSCDVLTADDDFLLWRTPVAITITDIFGVLQSGTSVIGGLDECDANGANPVAVDADITFDGGLDQDDGTLTNGGIDAGDWIRWHTTSVVAPGYLTVTIYYEID